MRCKDVIPVVASPHSTVVFITLESRLSVCAYPVTFTARKVTIVEVINRSQRASLPSHKVAVVAISRTREKSERIWICAEKMMPDTAWKTESELQEGYKGAEREDKRMDLPDEVNDPAGDSEPLDPPRVEELYHTRD